MNPAVVLPMIVLIALVFVMVPIGVATWSQFRRKKLVACPATHTDAVIQVDGLQAGLDAAVGGRRVPVVSCSLWPARRDCAQECTKLRSDQMRDVAVAR